MAKNQFVKDPEFQARLDDNERRSREWGKEYRHLTFSPGERMWLGIAIIFLLAIWIFLV